SEPAQRLASSTTSRPDRLREGFSVETNYADLHHRCLRRAVHVCDCERTDLAAGETSFKKCQACHSIGEGATNKIGPPLNGLAGRKTGTMEGYDYSEANKSAGIVWDDNTFKEYIQNPTAAIPGT